MKLIALLSVFLSFSIFATTEFDTERGRQFLEVYEDSGVWRVDSYVVEPGKLQEKTFSRSFLTSQEAEAFAERIRAGRTAENKSFRPSVRENGAVALWKVSEQWSAAWEDKYSDWVRDNLTKDFFQKNNLSTDCADVAYALRWIFARNNKLPATGTLAATGVVFTQDDGKSEWARLATHAEWQKDLRFLAALNWLLNNVYTKTLYIDTFPLEVSKLAIRPGAINLLGGHTELVAKVIDDGRTIPIQLLSSTVPRQVRELYARAFTDSSPVDESYGGLVQFRWPVRSGQRWVLTAKDRMPLYSREQYNRELCTDTQSFAMCVYQRLEMSFNPKGAIDSIVDSLHSLALARVTVVKQGVAACAQMNCAPGTQGWEDWSTPSRDGRLKGSYQSALQVVGELANVDWTLNQYFSEKLDAIKLVDIASDLSLNTFLQRLNLDLTSFDPRDGIESRWASSARGIALTVKNLIDRSTPQRQQMIAKAAPCRADRARCDVDSQIFRDANTIELDLSWRKAVHRYNIFCQTNKCPAEIPANSWDYVWFLSSLPWDSEATRLGSGMRTPHQIFYSLSQLIEMGDYLLINNVVHNRSTGAQITVPAETSLTYMPATRRLFAGGKKGIYLFKDGSFQKLALPAEVVLTSSIALSSLGKNHLVIGLYDDESGASPLFVVDLRTGALSFGLENRYYDVKSPDESAMSVLLNEDAGAHFLTEDANGNLQQRLIKQTEAPTQFWGKDASGWIAAMGTESKTQMWRYHATGRDFLVELPAVYSFVDLGKEWLVQTEGQTWRLGKSDWLIRERFMVSWFNNLSAYDTRLINFYGTNSQMQPYSIFHNSKGTSKITHPRDSELKGHHSQWLSFVGEKGNTVLNTAGQLLLELEGQYPTGCQAGLNGSTSCASNNESFAMWNYRYKKTTAEEWEITDFGNYGDLSSTRAPIAQKITRLSENNESTYISQQYLNDGGTLFSPAAGVVIYFPKK